MEKTTLRYAKSITAIALIALLIGQWALITGPVASLADYGRTAAESGNIGEFLGVFGLNTLLMAGIPLVFGGIGICVIAVYETLKRMDERQAQAVTVEHKE